jgi:8-oxo-dGTP pyrophosphatase MutT (NUDIX family)
MRTFPNVWVPPGGGIEPGESLEETGLRELFEEAGLKLNKTDIVSDRPLCLWESVYPQTLSRGSTTYEFNLFFESLNLFLNKIIGI